MINGTVPEAARMCRAVCYDEHLKVLMFGHGVDDCLASNLVDTSSRIVNTAFGATSKGKAAFPKAVPEQLRVLRQDLAERSHTTDSLAEMFKRKPRKSVEEGLQSLVAMGVAEFEAETQTWHTV
jgi:hypothetical protein